jgi:hypothetical protein
MRGTVICCVLLIQILILSAPAALAQQRTRESIQLFTYDPGNSGTVDAFFTTKFNRPAVTLRQPHTVPDTACGAIIGALTGSHIHNITFSVDFSDDTQVSNKANWVLIGIGRGGRVKHSVQGLNFDSRFRSAPGWITYNYSARRFQPPIDRSERLLSLSLSLVGGDDIPPTHADHWVSRIRVFGVEITRWITRTARLKNGYTVTP